MIQLLHLSDIQFGKHHRFGSVDSVVDSLTRDLDALATRHDLRPDLLVVTGDLAEWGKKAEFDDALAFLEALTEHLDLDRRRVVVVPGNHDVNRRRCEGYFIECEEDGCEPEKPYWPKLRDFASLFDRFYEDVDEITFTADQPWTLYEIEELRVVVAGLNSTMAESHEVHHGEVGQRQLRWFHERLERYQARGWLRIGAVHHNVLPGYASEDESLRDHVDLKNVLGRCLNLILHGHTHSADLASLLPSVPILSTGSAALQAAERPDVPNQYQVIRVRADGIVRRSRQYAPDRGDWIADPRVSERGDDWKDEHRVAFVDVHATFPDYGPRQADNTLIPDERDTVHERERDDLLARVERVCRLREEGAGAYENRRPQCMHLPGVAWPGEAVFSNGDRFSLSLHGQ